ncbi:MAG: membrane protein insertion efficiency factor YidD [Patescibacteria group bacterium]
MKLKTLLLKFVSFYQKFISPLKRPSCVFYPTCSEYTKEAIQKYGVLKGSHLGIIRIFRCHPWQKNNIDLLK